MQTTFADGTTIASLRWAGAPVMVSSLHYTPFGDPRHAEWMHALALQPDGDLLVGGDGAAAYFTTAGIAVCANNPCEHGPWPPLPQYAEMHSEVRERVLAAFRAGERDRHAALAPDGGFFTVTLPTKRGIWTVAHELRGVKRVLGRIEAKGGDVDVRVAVLADGSLVVLLFDWERGGPVGLYRGRLEGKGSLEVVQPYKPPGDAAVARDVVAVGGGAGTTNCFLVPSPRGVWFVTGRSCHPRPSAPPPIHVYTFEIVAGRLQLVRPPLALPSDGFDWPFEACAIAGQLAVGTRGTRVAIALTDGVVVHRVEGLLGQPWSPFHVPFGLVATPRGDALMVATQHGIARCDLLGEGDPRLAEPPYVEPPPPVPEEEVVVRPPPPRPAPRTLDEVVDRVRLLHVIHALSELHYGPLPYYGFEGDRARGRFYAHDGSGNHIAVGWDAGGVVACCYDHGFGKPDQEAAKEFWADVAEDRRKLAKALARWKPPIHGAAWFSAAKDVDGEAGVSEFANCVRELDEAKLLAKWQEHHSISREQIDLARSLIRATASGRHTLTDAEAQIALMHPEGGAPPSELVIAAASKQLGAVGVDWP